MIVKYFKTHGHLPLREILASAIETAKKMSEYESSTTNSGKNLEENTPEMLQIYLWKELLGYVQEKILYQSMNSQDVDKLLKILIASDLTMDSIEALIFKSNFSRSEFCQNVENTLANHWKILPNVPMPEVSELIYNYIMDSQQILSDVIFKALMKSTSENMLYIGKWAEDICSKFMHKRLTYVKLQQLFLKFEHKKGILLNIYNLIKLIYWYCNVNLI